MVHWRSKLFKELPKVVPHATRLFAIPKYGLKEEGTYLNAGYIKELLEVMVLFNESKQQRILKEIIAKAYGNKALATKRIHIRI